MPSSKNLPSIKEIGTMYAELVRLYNNFSGPPANPYDIPPYLGNLLGEGIVPSFQVRIPELGMNGRKTIKAPYHVGRVMEQVHIVLKSALLNIKLDEETPEFRQINQSILQAPIQRVFKMDRNNMASEFGTGTVDSEKANSFEGLIASAFAVTLKNSFSDIKSVHVTLEKHGRNPDRIDLNIPNIRVPVNLSQDHQSQPGDVSIAAMLWSLSRARQLLLANDNYPLIYEILGVQKSITENQQTILKILAPYMPPDKNIMDYIYIKDNAFKAMLEQEDHHLGMMSLIAPAHDLPTAESIRTIITDKPKPIDMKNNQWAARDMACGIHALAKCLNDIDLMITSNINLPAGREIAQKLSSKLSDPKYFLKKPAQIAQELSIIAQEVYAQCNTNKDDTTPLWRKVQSLIRSKPEMISSLKDAWLMVKTTGSMVTNIKGDAIQPLLDAMCEVVPQMARPAEYSQIYKEEYGQLPPKPGRRK